MKSPRIEGAGRTGEIRTKCWMYTELAAVFEGPRKFDAQLIPGLDADLARTRSSAGWRSSKNRRKPRTALFLPPGSMPEAAELLNIPQTRELSTNDYHIYRRPGEVMIVRWLAGNQVESFYERFQTPFRRQAPEGYKEDEHQSQDWKQDPQTKAYLDAIDAIDLKMADKYLRDAIKKHGVFVLSTQTADEMNISYLADHVMSVPAAELVGSASAPQDERNEKDLAWFYKLFSLRGITDGVERMCFFTFLQKSDDSDW